MLKKLKKEFNNFKNNWFSKFGIINRQINSSRAKFRNDLNIKQRINKINTNKIKNNNHLIISKIKSELKNNGSSILDLSEIINEKELFKYIEKKVSPYYSMDQINWKKTLDEEIKKLKNEKTDRTYNGKIWWIDLYKPDSLDNPICELSLNPTILNSVAQYMGAVPLLEYIRLIVNPPNFSNELDIKGNRLFHIDTTFKNMVKIFINPFDMKKENGPTYFLPKSYTNLKHFRNFPEPISDFELEEYSNGYQKDLRSTLGPPGKAYIIDVAKSLHQGGRCILPRTLLAISYVSPTHYMKKKDLINSDHMYYLNSHNKENVAIKKYFGL